ncbi:ATP-binding protein [Ruminiclostridium cellobioparum]|uniref:ATP-binding protein n=1 Tax=Ruminiclostridium cellobioparum TaxID=29355 RepID=UPI0028A8487E|nr:ATP-binding protein [Ruminiclostridium cellobioparum]
MKFWKGFMKLLRSLQWKLVYIFISMCVILVCVVYVVINSRLETIYYQNFVKDMNDGFSDWKELRGIPESNEDIIAFFKDKHDDVTYFRTNSDISLTLIDISIIKKNNDLERGILYSSDEDYKNNPETFRDELFTSSTRNLYPMWATGKITRAVEYKDIIKTVSGKQYFEYIIQPTERENLIFYFTYDKEAWEQILQSFNNLIFTSAVIAVFLSVLLGYLLSKTITSPIISVMHKAEKIAEGEFDEQLAVKSEDEIGNLTKTFNYMANELKNTLSEISSEKNKVVTILNYMADGVLAYDLKGNVIHINPAARRYLGDDIAERSFQDFAGSVGLDIQIENIVYLEEASVKEFDTVINDLFIKVYFAVFTDTKSRPEGFIVVLHDVTEEQKLDNMRREFVANVSHELRTPITSIKSYSETLLDGAVDDRETTEHFLNVINTEADRMTRLVKDLLQLSRLDNQQVSWNMGEVPIKDLVRDIVDRMRLQAEHKHQRLESYVIGVIPNIMGDKDRLEQVFVNLISNALKYTPENGEITVYIGRIYNDIYVKVADNGIGIPADSLPRVFERFYRVDKARSRDMGGTGLGLSIAKEIIQAHGGTISISSEEKKGTEITVRLAV